MSTLQKLDASRLHTKELESKLRLEMNTLATLHRIYGMNEIIFRRMTNAD
jgi:hypothetical protein